MDALDGMGVLHYRLYREHHRMEKDKYYKDLSFLNRDLSKVIVIDFNSESMETHPENGLYMKPWTGEKGDIETQKFTVFLQGIRNLFDIQN